MRPVFTLTDGTEVLETTGDAEAIRYGGGVLYRSPGHDVVWDFWDAPEKNFFIYSAAVPVGVLEHYDGVDIQELVLVAAGEVTEKEILVLSKSADPRARLQVVSLIRNAYGASHLDPEGPDEVTKFELASQWGFLFGVEKESVEEFSQEDYLIREHDNRWECGRIDGHFLGRFRQYKDALGAVADNMKKVGLFTNLFHEHEPGKIELIEWEPAEHIGRCPIIRGKMPSAQWKVAMRQYVTKRKPQRRKRLATSIRRSEAMRVVQRKRIEKARSIRDYLAR